MTDNPFDDVISRGLRVTNVVGRGSGPQKGIARLHELTVERHDGEQMTFTRLEHADRATAEITVLGEAEPMTFDRCPICLEPDPTDREHVPPEAVGGTAMTTTCSRCNNQFGSQFEVDLVNWYEDALTGVSLSHDDVPGARKTGRLFIRQTSTGKTALLPEGFFDPAISDRMDAGANFNLHYTTPDMRRVRIALLKNAYLAACVLYGDILETPEAQQVREELMAVRDVRRRDAVVPGPAARSIRFAKSQGPAVPGVVALVHAQPSVDTMPPHFAVSLAGTLLVSWVFGAGIGIEQHGQPPKEWPLGGISGGSDS